MLDTIEKIELFSFNLKNFLIEKNKKYGDSALNPIKIFSKLPEYTSIDVRIDDKLSRINNAEELRKNDVIDLIGYLYLKAIEKDWLMMDDLID